MANLLLLLGLLELPTKNYQVLNYQVLIAQPPSLHHYSHIGLKEGISYRFLQPSYWRLKHVAAALSVYRQGLRDLSWLGNAS
ncbi:hypothetical protein F5Y00DRAFT_154465 [Daldinia vernicosa]|uniref:uncharacterized protein n=1 Tax=Daldinia vernicosa TaxID=114800 RepID=UPI002008BD5A|nr:uncharacterized protein F5Y00DRAFT_154465 [Daldinia vernicosa]KAI0852777.1 hypothetical protein F5Y00DRAFT_154465 [Daldinia vernicosa]